MHDFKLRDVLAVILGCVLIVGVSVSAFRTSRKRVKATDCRMNLNELGVLYRLFYIDHDNRAVNEVPVANGGSGDSSRKQESASAQLKRLLKFDYSNAGSLVCPTDSRSAAKVLAQADDANISYFVTLSLKADPRWRRLPKRCSTRRPISDYWKNQSNRRPVNPVECICQETGEEPELRWIACDGKMSVPRGRPRFPLEKGQFGLDQPAPLHNSSATATGPVAFTPARLIRLLLDELVKLLKSLAVLRWNFRGCP